MALPLFRFEGRFCGWCQLTRQELKEAGLELGFSNLGVCDADSRVHSDFYEGWVSRGNNATMDYLANHAPIKRDVRALLPSVKSIVMVSLNYNQPNDSIPGLPRIARYALGRDYHKVLKRKLLKLSNLLTERYPDIESRVCVDSAPLLEREYAHLAGLGWFGKNTCLIDSARGSWFFLGALLTSHFFEPDQPSLGSCGSCRLCIDACPTGAIVLEDDRWQVDSRKCISYLTIEHRGSIDPLLATRIGSWTFGCDVCQEVCPFNTKRPSQPLRATETEEPDFKRRDFGSLEKVATLQEKEWDEMTAGSAVRRAGFEGLRRNALINLANGNRGIKR